MTTIRSTFTLDSEAQSFLAMASGGNKSAYINNLLKQEKLRTLEQAILQANKQEAENTEYQEELSMWDTTLSDGLNTDV